MKSLIFGTILFSVSCLTSCSYKEGAREVRAGNLFAVQLPNYLDEADDLKPGAPLQYKNKFRNIYVVGFKSDLSNYDFRKFDSLGISVLKNVLTGPKVSNGVELEVNGIPAVHTELFGKMQGENIFYSHLSVKGKKHWYELCVWTRGEERKLRFDADIKKILYSFREL